MRHLPTATALASACLTLTSCAVLGDDGVADTGIDPVPLQLTAPAYAVALPEGLLVRSGEDQQVVRRAGSAQWLPNGTALIGGPELSVSLHVIDPATGRLGGTARAPSNGVPGRSATQVNVVGQNGKGHELIAHSTTLEKLWQVPLPGTDNPDATAYNELERGYYGVAPTIDGATFVQWHDGSEWYLEGDYGVARVENGDVENVLVNERIVALYLSVDGAGLLAVRQSTGEPCGGCNVDQEIVEIDPDTGEIAAEYGSPEGYDDSWRVDAIDKVGNRVAVRYLRSDGRGGRRSLVGTYVYADGAWTMLEGSDREITWWQGSDRVVARARPSEPRALDGYELFWLHDDEETALRGELSGESGGGYATGAVAGQLLPPPA